MVQPKKRKRKFATKSSSAENLDAAVVQSLALLTVGDVGGFGKVSRPPTEVQNWLSKAPPAEVRGLLLASLGRWHELRKGASC
ncbi:MAG: hypothetical protein MI725_15830 [Pirellulales bacterium]|nr:hypothetical protein [Pirellulales bacterium]